MERSTPHRRSKSLAYGLIVFGLISSFLFDAIPVIGSGLAIPLIGLVLLIRSQIRFKKYRDLKHVLSFIGLAAISAAVIWIYFYFN